MALLKSIDSDYGVPTVYWNIGAYQEDFKNKAGVITLYGYASKEAREGGKQPISAAQVQIAPEKYKPDMTRADLYEIVKQFDQYKGAEEA